MPIIEFSNLNKYGNLRTRRFYHPTSNFGINPKGLGPTVIVKLHKYKHKHILPPCIAHFNGKPYIMPGWQEVVEGTTLNDVIHIKPKVKVSRSKTVEVKTKSSSSDIIYTTKYYPDSDKYYCDCPGTWRTRGNCKHIKQMRNDKNS
jgi:hypothetical protein|tara:strand:- start:203 stop:640 length:438 start_codon:yes stop_codon:yes gene_type:complete